MLTRKKGKYKNFASLLVTFFMALLCLYLIMAAHGCSSLPKAYIKGGMTTDLVGPDTEWAVLIDGGFLNTIHKVGEDEIQWGPNFEMLIFDSEDSDTVGFGAGANVRYNHHVNNNWNIYGGGGGILATSGYGNHANLADSSAYANFFVGFEYKSFILEIKHISSPFHNGDDGDTGINFINIGWKWE